MATYHRVHDCHLQADCRDRYQLRTLRSLIRLRDYLYLTLQTACIRHNEYTGVACTEVMEQPGSLNTVD